MGEVDENKINNMSYVFFQDVMAALGKKLNFESISNLYGKTTFDKKSGQAINDSIAKANPLVKQSGKGSALAMLSLPGAMSVIEHSVNQKEAAKKVLGDTSWFEDMLK